MRRVGLVVLASALALTGCSGANSGSGEGLTLDQAKQELYDVELALAELVPQTAVGARFDDWSDGARLLPCGEGSFQYSGSIALDLVSPVDPQAVFEAVRADWSDKPGWKVSDEPDGSSVEYRRLSRADSEIYVTISFIGERAHIVGFSECFAGDYDLDEEY